MVSGGGVAVHYPPPKWNYGGGTGTPYVITKFFDLEQVMYGHRQVGQLGKNGYHTMRLALISDNSVVHTIIQADQENYIIMDWKRGGYVLFLFWTKNQFFNF